MSVDCPGQNPGVIIDTSFHIVHVKNVPTTSLPEGFLNEINSFKQNIFLIVDWLRYNGSPIVEMFQIFCSSLYDFSSVIVHEIGWKKIVIHH